MEAFDPLNRERGDDEFAIPARIRELDDVGECGQQGRPDAIRRTIKWHFEIALTKPLPLVPQMMNKIKYFVRTRHKVNLWYAYKLRNIETNEYMYMVYYTNTSSPWLLKLSKTKEWLQEQEELRLQGERMDRPNTKWVFAGTVFVDLKVILDRQPLQIGLGRLPD